MRQMMKRFKNEKGLTLVELLAVVVILAIVSAIAFVMIGNVMENSKKDAAVANALQVISAAKLYEISESADFTEVSVADLQKDEGYIGTLYDPWDNAEYGTAGTVTKDDGIYTVNLLDASGCYLNEVEESKLIEKGREECGTKPVATP